MRGGWKFKGIALRTLFYVLAVAVSISIAGAFALTVLNLIDLTDLFEEIGQAISQTSPAPQSPISPPAPVPTPAAPVQNDIDPPYPAGVSQLINPEAGTSTEPILQNTEPLHGPIPMPQSKPDMWNHNYMVKVLRGSNSFGDPPPTKDGDDQDIKYWNVWRSCLVSDADPICKKPKAFRQDPNNWPVDTRTAQQRQEHEKAHRKDRSQRKKRGRR